MLACISAVPLLFSYRTPILRVLQIVLQAGRQTYLPVLGAFFLCRTEMISYPLSSGLRLDVLTAGDDYGTCMTLCDLRAAVPSLSRYCSRYVLLGLTWTLPYPGSLVARPPICKYTIERAHVLCRPNDGITQSLPQRRCVAAAHSQSSDRTRSLSF